MTWERQFAACAVVLGLLLTSACTKKKPQLALNTQAPTLTVPVPEQIPEESLPQEPPPPQQEPPAEEPPKKPPAKRHNPKRQTQPPASNPASNQPNNPPSNPPSTTVAVNHPPVNPVDAAPPDTAIAADVTSQQLFQQKQTTADLLDSTEKDLKGLNRSLSHDEENMVTQIKSYITQSHKATSDGDFERAYNLATKAHLLAEALLKK